LFCIKLKIKRLDTIEGKILGAPVKIQSERALSPERILSDRLLKNTASELKKEYE
tara:strand:+ start:1262 stop:1426 length:165 start_codon:yes stop_codon:yes gene_type:complete